MSNRTSLILCGVGGQGVLFASRVLALSALRAGLDVKVYEMRGLAQRFGSVYAFVKMGETVPSPSIADGEADALVALDPLEALRFVPKLRSSSTALLNSSHYPTPLETLRRLPFKLEEVVDKLSGFCGKVLVVDATAIAEGLGSLRVVNSVMLGALSSLDILPFSPELLRESLLSLSKGRWRELNREAFEAGRGLVHVGR